MGVQKGSKVSIHYKLYSDGNKLDSSEGHEPLTYVQGGGEIVPGLEQEIEGLDVGDKKRITVTPENGYGEHRPEGIQKVPRGAFKDAEELFVGCIVSLKAPTGQTFQATVTELGEEDVTLDLNHPLAGKTLDFDIEIVGIEEPPSRIIKPGK